MIDSRNAHELVLSKAPAGSSVGPIQGRFIGASLRVIAPNGKWAVVARPRQAVRLEDAHTGATLDTLSVLSAPTAASWRADSTTFAVGTRFGRISVWDEFRHRTLDLVTGHPEDRVNLVAISPDGRLVAGLYGDERLRVWETDDRREVARIRMPRRVLRVSDRLRFARDGRSILIGDPAQAWQLTLPR